MPSIGLEKGRSHAAVPRHDGTYNPIFRDPAFAKALRNYPRGEAKRVVDCLEAIHGRKLESGEALDAVRNMVATHFTNPLCHNCHRKPPGVKLWRCDACALVWYCSVECQRANWKRHKRQCCKPDADADPDCPYAPAVVPVRIPPGVEMKVGQVVDIYT